MLVSFTLNAVFNLARDIYWWMTRCANHFIFICNLPLFLNVRCHVHCIKNWRARRGVMVKLSLLSCSQEILSHEDTCLICSQIYETKCVHCLEMHIMSFKICKSVHHHTIQINQPTRCNNFSSLLLDVYLQLNNFRPSSRPLSGAQQLQ